MTIKQKNSLVKMFAWAIRQLFNENPGVIFYRADVTKVYYEAWNSVLEEMGSEEEIEEEAK